MFSIILTDGTLKNIEGDSIEWIEKSRMVKIYDFHKLVARINMNNVVGWINSDNIVRRSDGDIKEKGI